MGFVTLFWIFTLLLTVDAFRRPRELWVAADRNRTWWLSGLVVSSVILLPAVVFVPGYLLGVLPAFASGGSAKVAVDVDEFRRH